MDNRLKGNIAMSVSKVFSGFNQNALKYLVPTWMSPISGVAIRLCFGAIAFWGIGFATAKSASKPTWKQKVGMLLLGFVFMFGYMFGLLAGLKYTTPITSSIFISLQPATVFVLCAIFLHEKATFSKILGLIIGLGGALICILTQKESAVATNPVLGCIYCGFSTLTFSGYLILSKQFISKLDNVTVSKYSFTGGAVSSIIAVLIAGWDAPVFTHLWSTGMAALAFVLIFPTTVSYLLLDIGLRYLKATIVALYGNVILIVSTIMSYILGQDIFSWWQILAIVLMILSVYLVEVAERKPLSVQTPPSPPSPPSR